MDNKQEVRSPFQWQDNTLTERRRMRNDRKKKKRLQSRRGHRKSKADAVIEGLAARLQKESQQRERLLFLARKYYEKWKQNKVIMKSPREDTMKLPSFSRFGTRERFERCFKLIILLSCFMKTQTIQVVVIEYFYPVFVQI